MSLLGVYVHIPFCLSKCPYCGFNSCSVNSIPEEVYVHTLLSEIQYLYDKRFSDFKMVDTVYFGGGTPSLFSSVSIEKVLAAIAGSYSFSDEIEITLEANPGSLTPSKLRGFSEAGINRLNLGFQSLQDRLLQKMGRIHSALDAYEVFYSAREAGFNNLGVDLIFGIPGQKSVDLREDLEKVVALRPEHVAGYNLTIEPHTPFSRWVNQKKIVLPTEEEEAKMYELTDKMLVDSGYDHYEISNFALPGYHSKHNQKYWRLKPYIGIGAGAHSYAPVSGSGEMRWWNISEPDCYIRAVGDNHSGIAGEERLSERDTLKEAVFLGLRQLKGINLSDFKRNFGISLDEAYSEPVSGLVDAGLLDLAHDNLKLTSRGILLSDEVFQQFF